MRKTVFSMCLLISILCQAQSFKFDFTPTKKTVAGMIKIKPTTIYNEQTGYGFDLLPVPKYGSKAPFFFSVKVPDGNYKVTVVLGSKKHAGKTTVRAESRRLFLENVSTKKGELKTLTFTVNKRDSIINGNEKVLIKPRERHKLNWDNKLTFEINGDDPALSQISIEKAGSDVVTLFLCGNSTVVDQDNEPWASWGQMIPRFFDEHVCIANYAESGEAANTFIAAKRLKKALTQIKAGDYIFMEFGHNDQKQKGPGKGAYYSFMTNLKIFVDEAIAHGAHPVLITPTQRRSFDANGKIMETHLDFPDAMRWLAAKEHIPLIELHDMTRTLYETLGVEKSVKAFVHYPKGTFPGQTTDLADNTHFNPYGAYQVAKCVIEGMKKNKFDFISHLRPDYKAYDPTHPDPIESFHWNNSPFTEIEKPDGN
jgi:lysophospholipase L1-like esterase